MLTFLVPTVTKLMRERRKKLEEILRWKPESPQFVTLPSLSNGVVQGNSFTFSLSDGFKWKVWQFKSVKNKVEDRRYKNILFYQILCTSYKYVIPL